MDAAFNSFLAALAHVTAVLVISFRVIMRKPPVGAALAWLLMVAAIPAVGVTFYLLVGERRVGQRRAARIAMLQTDYSRLADRVIGESLKQVDWTAHRPEARGMDRLGKTLVGVPTVAGSSGKLFTDSQEILAQIAADIDGATTSVLMEFYIWSEGGLADEVVAALIRAARRGVCCRVLVDGLGSRIWWRGHQPDALREAGVKLLSAFPAGVWQLLFARNDLRLHRKIVVIDSAVAWTGSMNLVDPRFFKVEANVGQWVDAMVRLEGTVVAPLAMTIMGDWMVESTESLEDIVKSSGLGRVEPKGTGDVQVIPSGPIGTTDGLLQMLLALINSAREELVLTTPYFVPDEAVMRAIRGAAARGVQVHLIIPARVDSRLTQYASRSYFDELLQSGVRVHFYQAGLLHTKSITADREISMFGTVNLDMRSLWLNYEVSLFVYGTAYGKQLRELQQRYIDDSTVLDAQMWSNRPLYEKLLENTLRLMSPVL